MSVDLLVRAQAVRPDEAGGSTALLVLYRLAWRADKDGTVTQSVRRIASDLGIKATSVRRALRALAEHGIVDLLKPARGTIPPTYRVHLVGQNGTHYQPLVGQSGTTYWVNRGPSSGSPFDPHKEQEQKNAVASLATRLQAGRERRFYDIDQSWIPDGYDEDTP